ncbi:MAG TPA: hypothetical protein DD979_10320 [Gammaproteobacteria bacterium]|jgi:putative membrane protein|nr:hypothetical protein [Gammaproteobacteria bacterium]
MKLLHNSRQILLAVWVVASTAGGVGPVSAGELDDGAIIAIYNQVNTFDIETAGLGIAKGSSPQVVSLAEMVQRDHTQVRQMAAELANSLKVARTLPASRAAATAEHAKVLQRLSGLDGAAFDKAYLEHDIAFHTAAIQAVKEVLIPASQSDALRDLMTKILPGFEHHLAETQKAAKALGYL